MLYRKVNKRLELQKHIPTIKMKLAAIDASGQARLLGSTRIQKQKAVLTTS
jgi:hypothetical protein